VLDAGCGTGRVAIELARRGIEIVGVDIDPGMLGSARRKAPELTWIEADLATVTVGTRGGRSDASTWWCSPGT
jgi:ubiquinone/menaquinone biosynthesis C-methylase UbiE